LAQNGVYSSTVASLDVALPTLSYFTAGDITGAGTPSTTGAPTWSMTLARIGGTSSYGTYNVVWTDQGFDTTSSTIIAAICPVSLPSS
jgi:hypothetical protein